jgi:hypothetical protein
MLIKDLFKANVIESSPATRDATLVKRLYGDLKDHLSQRECELVAKWLEEADFNLLPGIAAKLTKAMRVDDLDELRDQLYREYMSIEEAKRPRLTEAGADADLNKAVELVTNMVERGENVHKALKAVAEIYAETIGHHGEAASLVSTIVAAGQRAGAQWAAAMDHAKPVKEAQARRPKLAEAETDSDLDRAVALVTSMVERGESAREALKAAAEIYAEATGHHGEAASLVSTILAAGQRAGAEWALAMNKAKPVKEARVQGKASPKLRQAVCAYFDLDDDPGMVDRIIAYMNGDEDNQGTFEFLFNHFSERRLIPYGTQKAQTGDPYEWVADKLNELFGDFLGE